MCEAEPIKDNDHSLLKKDFENLNIDFNKLVLMLDVFNGKIDRPINYDDLKNFPIDEWVDLNSKICIKRRNNIFKNYLNFDIVIMKGGCFSKHFHEDVIESCEVIDGKIIDRIDGEIYTNGMVMTYNKKDVHHPCALKNTELKVIFKP